MAEKNRFSAPAMSNEESRGGEDEEFYEKIEAPKFVDFTKPDHNRPDDRYWFCLRVGCDRKHEEELDHEAISKNFVLRVMAARSPNIRFSKALNRKSPSRPVKCPLSAPAKPSKSRLSRLALISSLSQNLQNPDSPKGKAKPLSNPNSTSKTKGKLVAAKYLTTPRNKKFLPNPHSFLSVQNTKPRISVPKKRVIAKALVFHSPKKTVSLKASAELPTPLTKICGGMKKLEITSQRKCLLGNSNKSSKEVNTNPNKYVLPVDSSRRLASAVKDRSKPKKLLDSSKCQKQEAKSLRNIKRKSKENLNRPPCKRTSVEVVEGEFTDMDIDVKSRDSSVPGNSRIGEGNGNGLEEMPATEITVGCLNSADSTKQEAVPSAHVSTTTLETASRGGMMPTSNCKEDCWEENNPSKFPALNKKEGDTKSEGTEMMDKGSSEKKRSSLDHQKNVSQMAEMARHENEATYNDDKENASASDNNRDLARNNHFGKRILGKQQTNRSVKTAQTKDQISKEEMAVAGTGVHQGMKYKKLKPTNPKPFRLRTDERRILKEATLERKNQTPVLHKETATVSMLPGRIHGNRNHPEESIGNHDSPERREYESERDSQKDVPIPNQTAGLKTLRKQLLQPKRVPRTPDRCPNSTPRARKVITSKCDNRGDDVSRRMEKKSPSLLGQIIRPKGVSSVRKAMASYATRAQKLTPIKETSTASRPMEEASKRSQDGTASASKATSSTASRSSSQDKKHATIPKKSKFPSLHTPKSCTKSAG